MESRRLSLISLAFVGGLAVPSLASAEEVIKVGTVATLEGPFIAAGQDSIRGLKLALKQHNGIAGGRTIEIIQESSDATSEGVVKAARKLVEQDGVQILVGPVTGDEGLAIKEYARTQPNVTFLNGAAATQDETLRDPAPNFFRFSADGAQWMAGLGSYVHDVKGYKKVATIGEDYSYPYTQVFGFMAEFCKAGGTVPSKTWVPIGDKDFSSVIAGIPKDVDAVFVALGGADGIQFLNQYKQSGATAPLIGGSNTADQTVLRSEGTTADFLVGMPSAGPIADKNDTPEWNGWVADYKASFPDALPSPSLFAYGYYVNTKAMLLALDQVKGDLSDGQAKFRDALSRLSFETPTGKVSLDKNRQAVADIYLKEVAKGADGTLYNKIVKVVPQVNQTLGINEADFLKLGQVGRDNPSCP